MKSYIACVAAISLLWMGQSLKAESFTEVSLARVMSDPDADTPHPLLTRELLRQAVLIAAHDELGMMTRDEVLGEPLHAAGALALVPDVAFSAEQPIGFRLLQAGKPDPLVSLSLDNHLWLGRPQDGMVKAEELSRHAFVDALKKAGITGHAMADDPTGAVDPAAEKSLDQLELLSQLAGVRLVDQQMRQHGESPARLAAIARGYANAWQLSDYLWGAEPKLLAARACSTGNVPW